MSTIRRQSIRSSVIIYTGFALGLLNTYLFTRQGGFTQSQYGLVGIFVSIATLMFSFANLGMQAYIYKFFPYYEDNLPRKHNDLLTWALIGGLIGFILVAIAGIAFKDLIIRKFGAHSKELITYYGWTFPLGFGLTIYMLLETYAWQIKKSVLSNFLREVLFRGLTTILILATLTGIFKSFNPFIKFFSLNYLVISIFLLSYLLWKKEFHIRFEVSRVTRKFRKKILTLASFVWGGGFLHNLAAVFGQFVIASVAQNGLADAGVFILAQYMTSVMQAPQRSIIAASTAPLSKAWKDKDFQKINLIYYRSSINQLVFSMGIFALIYLNFRDGIHSFHVQENFLNAQRVFLFLGLSCIIDMGTGVNTQIIATSTYWRFDFITGIILLALSLPLSYILTKQLGIIGPALSNLFSFTIYNAIRWGFLWKKFNMQPFDRKSVIAILNALAAFFISYYLFRNHSGILWILLRSITFIVVYLTATVYLSISPDTINIWNTIRKRIGI
jgi:O-antigen/teichoic acid export membrane protein